MTDSKHILIIEDDPDICKLLDLIVTKAGMDTTKAYSGTEGLLQLTQDTYDLILLDLMLPGMSGETLIQHIKEETAISIIVISAKVGVEDKINVLHLGADDYITKPFDEREVLARIEVQLRKNTINHTEKNEITWRGLTLDTKKRHICLGHHTLSLTNAEYDILALLIHHPEQAFSKRDIYERIWTGPYLGDDNSISVHVSNIRKKITNISNEEYIKTIWGIGFMLI